MKRQVLLQGGNLCLSRDRRLKVGPLGAIRGSERVLPAHRSGGRDIHCHAVQLLPHIERVDAGGSLAAPQPDAEALAFAKVAPGDVDKNRHAVLADHQRAAALFHGPVPP